MRRLSIASFLMLAFCTGIACGGDEGDDAGLFSGAVAGTGGTGGTSGKSGAGAAGRGGGSTEPGGGPGGTGDNGGAGGGAVGGKGGATSNGGTGGSVGSGGQASAGAANGGGGASEGGGAGTGDGSGDGGKGGEGTAGVGAAAGQGGSDDAGGAGGNTAGAGGEGGAGGAASGAGGGTAACTDTVDNGTMNAAADIGTIADNACTRLYAEKQLTGPADEDWVRYAGSDTLGTGCSTEPYAELVSGDAGEVCVFLEPATAASGAIVCLSGTNATSNGIAGCCSKSLARLQFGRYLGIDDATVWVVVRKAATSCAPYRLELGYGG